MIMPRPRIAFALFMFVCFAFLSGCASKQAQWEQLLEQGRQRTASDLQRLQQHLEAGHIRNATLLRMYARHIKKNSPQMAEIADTLALDASAEGPLYQGLARRLEDVSQDIQTAPSRGEQAVLQAAGELESIRMAAAPENFDAALSDPVNVLADMSGGELGRVESMAKEASLRANNAKDFGTGSQLIGNPNYGQWRQRSDGTSFWEFYGMYSMFSNIIGAVSYGDWARYRNYSYYHDWGRDYYRSPQQRRQENTVFKRAKEKFSRQGKSFDSPYAKKRGTTANSSSRFASRVRQVSNLPGKFSSSYPSSRSGNKRAAGASQRSSGSFFSNYNSRGRSSVSRSFGGGGK